MATGHSPIPDTPHTNDPELQQQLAHPPEDPQQFNDMWDKLDQEQKDWLYRQDHSIGNHPGMPFADKDHYNRMHLSELQAANQAEIDRLARAHPDWIDGKSGVPNPSPPGFQQWQSQWENANKTRQGYEQVQKAIAPQKDGLPRLLGQIDDKGHAAVSITTPTPVPGTKVPFRIAGRI